MFTQTRVVCAIVMGVGGSRVGGVLRLSALCHEVFINGRYIHQNIVYYDPVTFCADVNINAHERRQTTASLSLLIHQVKFSFCSEPNLRLEIDHHGYTYASLNKGNKKRRKKSRRMVRLVMQLTSGLINWENVHMLRFAVTLYFTIWKICSFENQLRFSEIYSGHCRNITR